MSDKVENRNRAVLDAAVALAERFGMAAVTRPRVSAESGLSTGTVSNAFGSMDGLRDAVMAAAVDFCTRQIRLEAIGENDADAFARRVTVVAQGLAERHPAAVNAPAELKQRALEKLAA